MWWTMKIPTAEPYRTLGKTWAVFADPNDPAAVEIHGREAFSKLSSPMVFQLAKDSLKNCITSHENCTKPSTRSPLPTRVVDCSDPHNPKLVSDIRFSPYIALSYVWGQGQPHSTTTLNVSGYHNSIPVLSLPATIRDAISATHHLGFRYLWTDTLCILQDSSDDKDQEIANMSDIFSNASVTLAAASAKKADHGFLHDIHPPSSTGLPFFSSDGRTTGTFFVREYMNTPPDEPINARAWCFQERTLSPRCLIFGSYTVQYQCQDGIANVGGTVPVYQKANFRADQGDSDDEDLTLPSVTQGSSTSTIIDIPNIGHSADHFQRTTMEAWSKIILNYTRRAVTEPTDRLVALSGVARVLHQVWWPQSTYLAGLWSHNLTQYILWRRMNPGPPYLGKYCAPSWSWAATDGEVDTIGLHRPRVNALWKVEETEVVPRVAENLFAGVKEGCRIIVEAIMRKVMWDVTDITNQEMLKVERNVRETGAKITFVTMDTTECLKGTGWAVVVGEVRGRFCMLHGLLVVKASKVTEGEGDFFRRVGIFSANEAKLKRESWEDMEE